MRARAEGDGHRVHPARSTITLGINQHEESRMRIEVKGRNLPVDDDLRRHVEKRFEKIAKQVSPLARAEVEIFEERNPSIRESQVAEAVLYLKGVTLRAREASDSMGHSLNLMADDLARQVKRHRDKRRGRRGVRVEPDLTAPIPAALLDGQAPEPDSRPATP